MLCGAALAAAHDAEKELSYLCDYEIEEHREKFEVEFAFYSRLHELGIVRLHASPSSSETPTFTYKRQPMPARARNVRTPKSF